MNPNDLVHKSNVRALNAFQKAIDKRRPSNVTQFPRMRYIPIEALTLHQTLKREIRHAEELANKYLDAGDQSRANEYAQIRAGISEQVRRLERMEGLA